MRKNHETSDLFAIIYKSKEPLSADQIAKQAKNLRHKVAPFLKIMVTDGQILEVRDDDQAALKFVINPQSPEAAAQVVKAAAEASAAELDMHLKHPEEVLRAALNNGMASGLIERPVDEPSMERALSAIDQLLTAAKEAHSIMPQKAEDALEKPFTS